MRILRLKLVILLCAIASLDVAAQQVLGGNITWNCLGGNQYQITFTLYKDCFGAGPSMPTENVVFLPVGCALTPFGTDLTRTSEVDVSELCASELPNNSCNGGLITGVQRIIYSGTVTLDPTCSWKIVWNNYDWNYFLNSSISGPLDSYISSTINPAAGCNNSVSFTTTYPVAYECANNGSITNTQSVVNSSGLTLAYALSNPQTTGATTTLSTDIPGYVPLNGLSVNPTTGALTFNSAGVTPGIYVATVQVTMNQGASVVGVVNQNLAIVIRDCTSTPTVFNPDGATQVTSTMGNLVSATVLEVCAGDSLCFEVSAENSNLFRSISFSETHSAALNPANITITQDPTSINPAVAEICLLTNQTMIGTQTITITAVDDACLFIAGLNSDVTTITINVYPSVRLSVTDTIICYGASLPVTASGASTYVWSVNSGDSTPGFDGNNAIQILESIGSDTEIKVVVPGVPAMCHASDTLTVQVALSDNTFAITNETCIQNDGAINLSVLNGVGPYTYNWTPGNIATQDLSNLDSGNYTVVITDTGVPTCTRSYTQTVNTSPPPGGTMSAGGATTICNGGSTTLSFALTGNGPWIVNGTGAGVAWPVTLNNAASTITVSPSATTTYTLTSIAYTSNPLCITNVNFTVPITVRPLVTGTFSPAGPICSGDPLVLSLNLNQPGNYNVTYSANPVDPASAPNPPVAPWTNGQSINGFNPAGNTIYTITDVQYTTAPACSNPQNNPITVVVRPLPTAALTGTTTICTLGSANLPLVLGGSGPWSVNGTGVGVTWPLAVNTANSNISVSPAGTTTYCVTSVTDANGCTSSAINDCETVTVQSQVTPTITISANQTFPVCDGTSIIFSAVSTNGGAAPTYSWKKNGAPVGAGSTYTTTTYVTGDAITCDLVSNAPCANPTTVSSTGILISETPLSVPSVTIAAVPSGAICAGTNVTFTVTPTNGGLTPTYQWTKNGANIVGATLVTYSSNTLANGDIICCVMTSSLQCPSPATASACQTMVVNALQTPSVVANATATTLCQGQSVTFTAAPTNAGAGPTYQWFVGATSVGTGNTYTSTTLNNNDQVKVVVTSNATCPSPTTATSPIVTMTVNPLITPLVTLTASATTICAGTAVTFTATPTSGGGANPTYQWTVNGVNQSTANPYVTAALTNGANVCVIMTSNATCPSPTTDNDCVVMTVNPILNASVTVTPSATSVCAGANVSFTANPTNGGAAPAYQWLLNSNPIPGATSATYTSTSLANTNQVSVQMTSNAVCPNPAIASSAATTMTINPLLVPSVTITTAITTICAGASATFTATPTNPGTAPIYQWYNGAAPIAGATLSTYTTTTLANNSSISCILTSNALCATPTTATSNSIVMTVNPILTPSVTIAGAPNGSICAGSQVLFTATPTNPGTTPHYQWYVGLTPVGTDSDTYTTSALANGNQVTVQLTSNAICPSSTTATSNVVTQTVNSIPTAAFAGNGQVCSGSNYNFSINFTGVSTYSYDVYNGAALVGSYTSNANTGTFTTNAAGTYTIQNLSDANCPSTATSAAATLSLWSLPTAQWDFNDTSFCVGSNIDLLATVSSGLAPYSISINGNAAVALAGTTYTQNVTAGGTYTITQVTDAHSCAAAPNDAIIVTQIALPTVGAGSDMSACSGQSITIGTPAVVGQTYSWTSTGGLTNSTNAQATATNTNNGAADVLITYTVTAYSAQCSATDDMVVTVHALPTLTLVAIDDSLCFGAQTSISVSGASQYLWHPGSYTTANNLSQMTANPTITEWFYVDGTDANLCTSTDSIKIVVGTPLTAVIAQSATLCYGVCNGYITITPSGSFSPYTIGWSSPQPGLNDFSETNLCAGTYDFAIYDAIGCNTLNQNLQVILQEFQNNPVNGVLLTQPVCFGDQTGSIEINEPGSSYTLFEQPANTILAANATGVFTNLGDGLYSVLVIDPNNCTTDTTGLQLQTLSPQITITAPSFPVPFCFQDVVPFAAQGLGGSGALTYHWTNCPEAVACQLSTNNPYNFTLTQDTTLFVYVTDVNVCSSDTIAVNAVLNPPIGVVVQGGLDITEICQGQCLTLTSAITGGNGNVQLDWYEVPDNINDTPISNTTQCPLFSTEFYAYAHDGCNPPAYDTLSVTVFETPEVVVSSSAQNGCFPLQVELTYTVNPPLQNNCTWNFGNGITASSCDTIVYAYPSYGQYYPYMTVVTADGCISRDSLNVPITIYTLPEVNFDWTPNPVDVLNNVAQFSNQTENATSYHWQFDVLGESILSDPSFTFPDIDLAVFDICLEARTAEGCKDTLCKELTIASVLEVFAPNSFTPDGDNKNDIWIPVVQGADPKNYHLWIYDKWGILVFETTDPDRAWTGNVMDGAYYPQGDIFVWRMELKHRGDSRFEVFDGHITMIR